MSIYGARGFFPRMVFAQLFCIIWTLDVYNPPSQFCDQRATYGSTSTTCTCILLIFISIQSFVTFNLYGQTESDAIGIKLMLIDLECRLHTLALTTGEHAEENTFVMPLFHGWNIADTV